MILYAICGLQKVIVRDQCLGSRVGQGCHLDVSEPASKGVHPADLKPCQRLVGPGLNSHMFAKAQTVNAVEIHFSEPRASGAEEQAPGAKALSPSGGM